MESNDHDKSPINPEPPIFQKLNPKTRGYLAQTIKARQEREKEQEQADSMGGANEQTSVYDLQPHHMYC